MAEYRVGITKNAGGNNNALHIPIMVESVGKYPELSVEERNRALRKKNIGIA
jgi:hypothetical protein